MRMTGRILSLAVVLGAVSVAAARPVPDSVKKTPLEKLVSKSGDLVEYHLTLEGAVFQTKKDKKTGQTSREPMILRLFPVLEEGKWQEKAAASAPTLNKGSSKALVDADKSRPGQLHVTVDVGSDRWVKGDPKAEYVVELKRDGREVRGSFTGTFQGEAVKGKVTGMARIPGWVNARNTADGLVVQFDMGTKRSNWNNARWAVRELIWPADLTDQDGLVVTIATDKPRSDVFVDVAAMEDDGSWYYVRDAVPLSSKVNTAVVPFSAMRHAEWIFNSSGTGAGAEGNFDENFSLDLDQVVRVAVGVVNSHGVGKVGFTVADLQAGRWKDRKGGPVRCEVTGRTVKVNDQQTVPAGIFGFHTAGGSDGQVEGLRVGSLRPLKAMGGGGAFVRGPNPGHEVFLRVCTQYDRKQLLPQTWGGDWKSKCVSVGKSLASQGAKYGDAVAIEWWNEPYLDLGRMLEKHLTGRADNKDSAKAGDAVVYRGEKLESMVWESQQGGDGKTRLVAKDPSRFTYWSGRQIGVWYNESFNVVAAEAKKGAPDLQMVGGFGFRWQEDDWASWDLLYKPMIDACIEDLDGVCEHHYQGHTDGMAASYEVLVAYGRTRHDKTLTVYNTETNDLWDAPARGRTAANFQHGGRFVSRKRMIYNLRDILYCVKETPDKIRARAIHALWKSRGGGTPWGKAGIDKGEYLCLKFLHDLRGRLVQATSSDDSVWVVSSIDDVTGQLVTVVFNDGPDARDVSLTIAPPEGTSLGGGSVKLLDHNNKGEVDLRETAVKAGKGVDVDGVKLTPADENGQVAASLTVKPSHAVAIGLKLAGDVPAKPDLVRTQYYCHGVLKTLKPGDTATLKLKDFDAKGANRAWLRLVVEHVGHGEGWVEVGGKRFAIPAAHTPCNSPYIRQIEIDPKLLDGVDSVTFGAAGSDVGNGFVLGMGSVVIER